MARKISISQVPSDSLTGFQIEEYTSQVFSAPAIHHLDCMASSASTQLRQMADRPDLLQPYHFYMRRYEKSFHVPSFLIQQVEKLGSRMLHSHFTWKSYGTAGGSRLMKSARASSFWTSTSGAKSLQTSQRLGNSTWRCISLSTSWMLPQNYSPRVLDMRRSYVPCFAPNHVQPQAAKGDAKQSKQRIEDEPWCENPLEWCLAAIHNVPVNFDGIDRAALFRYLQHLLSTSPREDLLLIDEVLHETLSSLAAGYEMMVNIRPHRPGFLSMPFNKLKSLGDDTGWIRMLEVSRKPVDHSLRRKFGKKIDVFHDMPLPHGPKNTEWLKCSQSAHSALNDFWTAFRAEIGKMYKASGQRAEDNETMMKSLTAADSQKHGEAIRAEEQQVLANIERIISRKVAMSVEETSEIPQFIWGADNSLAAVHLGEQPQEHVPESKISLPKRSFHVMMLMFPAATEDVSSKWLAWNTFVNTMVDAGLWCQE
ncbi:hypothetical protein EJ08DRAFT_735658 [Tothia fuscella]|uniref:Uncharacterized protein n=1 Tax=Tothia fuscella TaxID=1048955 RepID=A0A9P4TX46_9PEZI|nr:hypothetical protein EJ08DRAFT_735658 [Tothia fuscella]